MEQVHVDNNQFRSKCPCCNSLNIKFYSGDLEYLKPVYYSTIVITLQKKSLLYKCKDCESIFKQNFVSQEQSITLYSAGESGKRWNNTISFQDEKTKTVVDTISKYLKNGKAALDIGCSNGRLLDFLKSKGINDTYGIEYSEESRKICTEKGHVIKEDFSKLENSLDYIFAFDLIEHLYDLPLFLNDCKMTLKKSGLLIILTGNPNCAISNLLKKHWWYYNYPEHIVFPSKKFYSNIEGFTLIDYKEVFNAKSYKGGMKKTFFRFLSYFRLYKKYIGLPSIIPDHHLLVLQRNE